MGREQEGRIKRRGERKSWNKDEDCIGKQKSTEERRESKRRKKRENESRTDRYKNCSNKRTLEEERGTTGERRK